MALQKLRSDLGSDDPRPLFESLAANAVFTSAIAVNRTPMRFEQLGQASRLRSRGLENDVRWDVEVLVRFATELVPFLTLKTRFESAYVRGDVDGCIAVLDEVQAAHGLSIWLISRKTLMLRRAGGTSHGDYTSELLASSHSTGVTGYLTYLIGYRSDPNVSPAAFARTLDRLRDSADMPETLRTFLIYHLENAPPTSFDRCAGILETGEPGSLIDRYEALIDVLQHLAASPISSSVQRDLARRAVDRLSKVIADPRLSLLCDVLADKPDLSGLLGRLRVEEADAYTEGRYEEAHRLLLERMSAFPEGVHLLSLLARTRRRTGGALDGLPPFLAQMTADMAAAYAFDEGSDAAVSALVKESMSGAHGELSAAIRALLANRAGDPSVPTFEDRCEALNASALTPLQLRNLPTYDPSSLMAAVKAERPLSIAVALQAAVADFGVSELDASLSEALPPDRGALYRARALQRLGRFRESVELLRGLDEASFGPVANDARRDLFDAYVALEDVDEALRVVARAHLVNQALHLIFRLEPLLDSVERREGGPPFDQISLAICYHIHNRHHSDQRLSQQADAAEEYALSGGADLPSGVPDPSGDDLALLPLYLDEVCSAPVLDKFMAIDSVDDVEVERLEICRRLVENDPANRQRYLEEIREITRRRVVRERFEQVERTKIYVDTEGVKRQAEKGIREAYHRFIAALSDPSHGDEAIEMMRQVQDIIADAHAGGVRIHFPDLPTNERDRLFEDIVRDLTRTLISSQEYGLEAYLSTRVRHGTMGNQLRSAFETNALLTQKDDGKYVADYTWSDQLDLSDMSRWAWLAQRLADFSEQLDSAIEELVRRRVQVRSEAFPEGLFVFTTYNYDILQMQSGITPETTFDVFMDRVIDRFWSVLDESLAIVREHMNGPFLAEVLELTDGLQLDIARELHGDNASALSDAIASARTQMAVNVANVANWFTLAREMERPDYEFGVAVEVATQSIVACHPTLGFELGRTDDMSFECRGRSLESLVYLLFTALDNAIEHSGLVDHPPEVTLSTTLEGGWLWLTLSNSCAEIDDVDAANADLAQRRVRLENAGDLQSLATTEGGSGYAKIIRILKHDLLAQHALEFGYVSPTEYQVRVGVEAKAIVK